MATLHSKKHLRWLQSELVIILGGLGLLFLFHPELFNDPTYAPLRVLHSQSWAFVFLGVASIGFTALYQRNAGLWKMFCSSAVFLLVALAVARGMAGQLTATVTYSGLAYSAILRSLGIPSITLVHVEKRP